MSQPQMQQRPSMVNGVNRRRADRDLGNRPESFRADFQSYRPFHATRSGTSNPGTEGFGQSAHQYFDQGSSDASHAGCSRPSGERGELFPQSGSHGGGRNRPLNERLLFMTACLIGQPVEVQVKNGSIYSGVFHTANAERDYGVVLKMARLVKDGLLKVGKSDVIKDLARRVSVKTFIIHANDLVQIIAKDVPMSGELLQNARASENRSEIMTDSFLSQGRHGELERELKPWTPDRDDPKDTVLESTFDNTWNRNWDQFEINKTLFGVESTFDEELYTTKLERGPQMREREREAWRIAREIEGQATKNLHLAEERGVQLSKELKSLDEESRFSSVLRLNEMIDVGDENDDVDVNIHNDETFRNSFDDIGAGKHEHNVSKLSEPEHGMRRPSSTGLSEAGRSSFQSPVGRSSPLAPPGTTNFQALNLDPGCPQVTEDVYREFNEFKQQESAKRGKKQWEDQVNELKSFSESLKDFTKDLDPCFSKLSINAGKNISDEIGARPSSSISDSKSSVGEEMISAAACTLPASSRPAQADVCSPTGTFLSSDATTSTSVQSQSTSPRSALESARVLFDSRTELGSVLGVAQFEAPLLSGVQTSLNPSNEAPISPLNSMASTTAPSSPSSVSALAKKSFLNPNAKEFKLNPNAKSFTPTFRPPSPVVQGSVYVPGGVPPVAQMQAIPLGVGVSPLLQQPASTFPPYNYMAVAATSNTTPVMQPTGVYAPGVSGAGVPPLLPGQAALRIPPQVQQPVIGHSFPSQQALRYTSQQALPVQPAPTYLHPNSQLYSQQMMFGQPGQVVYIHPFPQAQPMPASQSVQAASQHGLQPRHRGGGVQGMPFCMAPPFLAGQQHFVQQVQMPHIHNPLQPNPSVLAPTSMPGI